MINSRNMDDLDPFARTVCVQHIAKCKENGIEIIITSTWRDFEAQDRLYAIGRNGDPRRAVTNAKAGQSWHNFKVAWDVVPVVQGKAVWDAKDPLWKEVIAYGKEVGAEAGADWTSFPDLPHFQVRPTREGAHINLQEATERFQSEGTIFTA